MDDLPQVLRISLEHRLFRKDLVLQSYAWQEGVTNLLQNIRLSNLTCIIIVQIMHSVYCVIIILNVMYL